MVSANGLLPTNLERDPGPGAAISPYQRGGEGSRTKYSDATERFEASTFGVTGQHKSGAELNSLCYWQPTIKVWPATNANQ